MHELRPILAAAAVLAAAVGCGRLSFDPRVDSSARDGAAPDAPRRDGDVTGGEDAARPDASGPSSWRLVPGANEPGGRWGPHLVFDEARGEVLLYGGNLNHPDLASPEDDMWRYDGSAWSLVCDPCPPGPRQRHVLVYDAARDVVVLYGGERSPGIVDGELWEWDGTDWVIAPSVGAPAPRASALGGYDPMRGRVVIFGGHAGDPTAPFGDLHEWDGTTWSSPSASGGPTPRANDGQSATWIGALGAILFYGGTDKSDAFDDAWSWNGTSWSRAGTDCRGRPYEGTALVDVAGHGLALAIGGYDAELDLTVAGTQRVLPPGAWPAVDPQPSGRDNCGVAYDPIRDVVVLYGGNGEGCSFSNCDETLEYTPPP